MERPPPGGLFHAKKAMSRPANPSSVASRATGPQETAGWPFAAANAAFVAANAAFTAANRALAATNAAFEATIDLPSNQSSTPFAAANAAFTATNAAFAAATDLPQDLSLTLLSNLLTEITPSNPIMYKKHLRKKLRVPARPRDPSPEPCDLNPDLRVGE